MPSMDLNDRHSCHRALQTRDRRFDGRLFIGVTSTGIYCRPICPARTAHIDNCQFYPSAAAAQQAGFRPCLRCRPESAPGGGIWRGSADTVARALDWMSASLDEDEARLAAIAARLGVSDRQLRRLFNQHLGASPVAVLQTRRILLAKQLIHETTLPMTQVALAAGFGSVRRFNETFRAMYRRAPSALRRAPRAGAAGDPQAITLALRFHASYDWPAMLASLRAQALPGVETIEADSYRRGIRLGELCGEIRVAHRAKAGCLALTVRFPDVKFLPEIVSRVGRVFDLGADMAAIEALLAQDAELAPLVAARPGLRLPGVWDPFEAALAAAIGFGADAQEGAARWARFTEHFAGDACLPSARQVAAAAPAGMGPQGAMLTALAQAAIDEPALFTSFADAGALLARLGAAPAIGPAAAQAIVRAALRDSDSISPGAEARLGARADALRPWRAYAVQHLDMQSTH